MPRQARRKSHNTVGSTISIVGSAKPEEGVLRNRTNSSELVPKRERRESQMDGEGKQRGKRLFGMLKGTLEGFHRDSEKSTVELAKRLSAQPAASTPNSTEKQTANNGDGTRSPYYNNAMERSPKPRSAEPPKIYIPPNLDGFSKTEALPHLYFQRANETPRST
ncbi:hypothetical protein H4R33_000885 [Dimargaris cristalligena]|nr:hypothetical protein H4R33_000885 [Dimargaris cristalligena]